MISGVLFIAPFYAAEVALGSLIVASRDSALAIFYVAIFPSFFAYLFFNRGVELIGSASTGQFVNVIPLMGSGPALLFLGEDISTFHIIGLALIFGGIFAAGKLVPAPDAINSNL